MPFPVLPPTSRDFKPGDYPVKTYSAQSGAEVRILYGDTRTRMELSLGYDNATDAQAKQFLDHYDEVKGSFSTFEVDPSARAGWGSTSLPARQRGWKPGRSYCGPIDGGRLARKSRGPRVV